MDPRIASKKIRKNEEGHLDHPRVTEIHKGAISRSIWYLFAFILKLFSDPFSDLFGLIFVNPPKFAAKSN